MCEGKICKGIAGFYYVDVVGSGVYECKAKGVFRKEDQKPLVGDQVTITILDEQEKTGNITSILPRKSELIRPAVANVDQALVVFAFAKPDPHFHLLDRFLVSMEAQQIPCLLCFNKGDLVGEKERNYVADVYGPTGYPLFFSSVKTREGLSKIRSALSGKTTVVAGPSGVGKSSIINALYPSAQMETGEISRKTQRGKQTTRHSELFLIGENTYLMDTPGFSSLFVEDFEKEALKNYFPEFAPYEGQCRFHGCNHVKEPGCAVKEAVHAGKIHPDRYQSYVALFEDREGEKRY